MGPTFVGRKARLGQVAFGVGASSSTDNRDSVWVCWCTRKEHFESENGLRLPRSLGIPFPTDTATGNGANSTSEDYPFRLVFGRGFSSTVCAPL